MAEKTVRTHIPEEARQHYRAAREEMRKGIEMLFPEGFFAQKKKARREMLLAWRTMLDAAIKRMDEKD